MTGNSTPRRGARERALGASPPRAGREGTRERGEEMPRRFSAVTGKECVSARYEFRWNHGLHKFALSRKARGVFS